jgi:nucleoside-diphosphate-sugar epimerase
MRIAVTGATGFIGRHLVSHFASRGDAVVPVGRPLEREALAKKFRGADTVVHLAGVVSTTRDEEYVEVNVGGARAVAEAARERGVRLVHVSSLAAAGPSPPGAPRTEDDPPAPMTAYGRSKLEGERVIAAIPGLPWTVLRPGVVYGSGDRALLPLFVLASRGVLPLIGRASAAYTFVHVSDLVRAIAAAVDQDARGDTETAPSRPVASEPAMMRPMGPRRGPSVLSAGFPGVSGFVVNLSWSSWRSRFRVVVSTVGPKPGIHPAD